MSSKNIVIPTHFKTSTANAKIWLCNIIQKDPSYSCAQKHEYFGIFLGSQATHNTNNRISSYF